MFRICYSCTLSRTFAYVHILGHTETGLFHLSSLAFAVVVAFLIAERIPERFVITTAASPEIPTVVSFGRTDEYGSQNYHNGQQFY